MRKKRSNKIGILVAILLLAVGFAAVTTTLYINGTAKIVPDKEDFKKVKFDKTEGQSSFVKGTGSISEDGRTLTFESEELTSIGEEASMTFRIANESSYDAQLGNPAITCSKVLTYATGEDENYVAATLDENDDHIQITAGTELDDALIPATNGFSDPTTVKVKLIKSYIGDENDVVNGEEQTYKTIKFQCTINATAAEVTD